MSFKPLQQEGRSSDLDAQAKERLKQLAGKKAISSKDVFGEQEKMSEEVSSRFQQLAGAKAISSDMFFGRKQEGSADKNFGEDVEGYIMGRSSVNSNNSYDEYKEAAVKIAEKVSESAKVMKDKALDWLSTFATGQ